MKKLALELKKIPKDYFTLNDVRKISRLSEGSLKVAVHRMVKRGELVKLGGRLYTLVSTGIDYERIACEVYNPSYVSFESSLSFHNILSQKPIHITLATVNRPKRITLGDKDIIYHHLQKKLFWGYEKTDNILMAKAEKALLDLAYLSLNGYASFDAEEMNLNSLDKGKLIKYLKKINSKKLNSLILKNVLIHNALDGFA